MAIRVALHHKTVYEYDRPVTLSPQVRDAKPADKPDDKATDTGARKPAKPGRSTPRNDAKPPTGTDSLNERL